jgi:hypothetical protein
VIRSYHGKQPLVPDNSYIDLSAQVIGDVELGEHSSVWMNAVLRGDVNSIRVGSNSNVQDCAVLHGQRYLYSVTVGDWVTIGHNATVHGRRGTKQCSDRGRVDYRRWRGGAGGDRGAGADTLGWCAGEDAAGFGGQGSRTDFAVCEELPGLYGDLSARDWAIIRGPGREKPRQSAGFLLE